MKIPKPLLILIPALLAFPAHGWSQGFNGKATTYVNYLQIRDIHLDSVPIGDVAGIGSQRTLEDGTRVSCSEEYCEFYRSGDAIDVIPVLQDLELNVWTGITGLRAYAHVRARKPLGDEVIWPRSRRSFEALTAYVEYGRSRFRAQAGRIWQTTALGFYNYDGGSLTIRLPSRLDLDFFGGRSLIRGLNQPHRTELISSVEPLGPEENTYLQGVHVRWSPLSAVGGTFTYQREAMIQSHDLYAERIAGTARVLVEKATLDMEVKYDLSKEETNLARISLSRPLFAGFRGTAEVKRYTPFFELWTIWGAFSPVGYDEARARLDWMRPDGRLAGYTYGSYQKYADTHVEAPAGYEIRDNSWRWAVGGRYTVQENLTLAGEYRYDEGYGASRSGGDVSVQRSFGRDRYLAFQGTAFETFSEFQVGSGRVVGGGIQGATPLGFATVQGGAMFYKHTTEDRPGILDLNQARLNLSVEIPIGSDPGLAGRGNQ
jgi:hypothetical protein